MKSLRGRLRFVLGATLVFCWVGGVGLLVAWTASSESSIWDSKLQAFGTRLLVSVPASAADDGPFSPGLELPANIRQEPFAIQIWNRQGILLVKTPGPPYTAFEPSFRDGFSTRVVAGAKWRVYTVSDRRGLVSLQVAQLQSVIDREMRYEALTALGILTAVLSLMAVLLGHALDRSLRPIDAVERALLQRSDLDFTPLPLADLPLELQPLVTSFNHTLHQLDKAIDAERRFIGDAAHELRTPLSALQAQADVALHAVPGQEQDDALRTLQQVARRSTRLAEQLLDMARLDALADTTPHRPVDLPQLVAHVVSEYAFQATQRNCRLDIDAGSATIAGDVNELGTLLRNLVENALRFAGDGGRVRVACGMAARHAFIEVADDGPGVPQAEHAAIFQRFYRIAANQGRGSGIGLSLVAAIARLHHARIVTGAGLAGRGFMVRIDFPSTATLPAPAAGRSQNA